MQSHFARQFAQEKHTSNDNHHKIRVCALQACGASADPDSMTVMSFASQEKESKALSS